MLSSTVMVLALLVQGAPLKKSTRDNPPPKSESESTPDAMPAKEALKPSDGKCCSKGKAEAWPGYNQGVVWNADEKYVWELAKADRKIVLYFQLVGDLDKEGC